MRLAVAGIVLACGFLAVPQAPEAGRGPLVCIAPLKPADFQLPIATVSALEFYADEGSPLLSYANEFDLVRSVAGGDGHVRNDYRVGPFEEVRATIVFIGDTAVSFTVAPLKRTYVSLAKNEAETASMADVVPGVVCYSATIEATTF
jgi:hypothetical protein